MFGIREFIKSSIAQIIKRENEVANLCAMHAISKEEAEAIQKAHHKYSMAIINPMSLEDFASTVINNIEVK